MHSWLVSMSIDGCNYSFQQLSEERLPSLMKLMRERIKNPINLALYAQRGNGKAKLLEELGKTSDFQGCYVLIEGGEPIYVGISRGVAQRLIQHIKGTTHFDASFAYRIASHRFEHSFSRRDAMSHEPFRAEFEAAKEYIAGMSVSHVEIANDLELYLFEAYCAMELDTSLWNTFRTH